MRLVACELLVILIMAEIFNSLVPIQPRICQRVEDLLCARALRRSQRLVEYKCEQKNHGGDSCVQALHILQGDCKRIPVCKSTPEHINYKMHSCLFRWGKE